MKVYRAAWLCPIAQAPISHGWFAAENRRITRVGAPGEPLPAASAQELGCVAILPGLVNAHTHLELSWLRGRVPPAASFVEWIKQLFLSRGDQIERADDQSVIEAALVAGREARAAGTIAVADISNSLATIGPIRDAGLTGLVFHELLGFNLTDGRSIDDTRHHRDIAAALAPEYVRVSLAPHAPYSVSPELFRAIRAEIRRSRVPISSVHLGESPGETEFLRDGSGPWPGFLRMVGSHRDDWQAPGLGPVEYLDSLGVLDADTLVVHGVQLDDASLARLAAIGCTLVTCPRSNQWVGVGAPPVARFYASGVKVALGTDSLASVEDLNPFSELKTMRWLAPAVPARQLLESATLTGARALGLGDELGSIEPGKRAALIAVDLPARLGRLTRDEPDATDGGQAISPESVEEYLLTGIEPGSIRWVTA
jgi:cytosine/adenosine deaminase-related metal-dependent hydrolase